ncbi:hypothetical protein HNV11_06305 [Spirosoma taeanense]|uniref:Uncharacterized protein n=1 Tax=Spirosoma taeanense TaxID=2735870 RepID=A0A6M5YG18_9BACT|nr:hypothetical protein HNV11_06305 [Spirosoma taeanense]
MQKQAGNYQVLVSINPPDVVPGTARVTVYVERGRVGNVEARAVYFNAGDEASPSPDRLIAAAGQPNNLSGDIWLMDIGSASIEIFLNGPDGKAKLIVPVMSVATAQRTMPVGTGALLAGLGVLLVVMLITIIGVSVTQAKLNPGQAIPAAYRIRQRLSMALTALVLLGILTAGRFWWESREKRYQSINLYRQLDVNSTVKTVGVKPQLLIEVDTASLARNNRPLSFIVPDHGKLMHTFLVRFPQLDAFAHLHPIRHDTLHYQTALPPLPPGQYRLYTDVVYQNGFAETLTDTVTLRGSELQSYIASDRDDSWLVDPNTTKQPLRLDGSMASCGKPGAYVRLSDGSTMIWTDKPTDVLETDQLYQLQFAVADAEGRPAPLEPYLGMSGHAALVREDGQVYMHLHPVGTYSMAAETSLVRRIADTARTYQYPNAQFFRDSIDRALKSLNDLTGDEYNQRLGATMPGMVHEKDGNRHLNMVAFPYQFPSAGRYRIWVQVKRNGRVLTGAFETQVRAAWQ